MSRTEAELLDRAEKAKRESRYLDFKETFDPSSDPEFIELVKDLVAMANSGGGVIVVGVRNNATLSGAGVKPVLDLDPAKISDKVYRYTGAHFSGFSVHEVNREGEPVAAIVIDAAPTPLVFTRPGTYPIAGGGGRQKQKTAFGVGTLYVRHGAKSEPATTTDLRDFVERRLEGIRESWLGNIRRVMAAPAGTDVAIYEQTEADEEGRPTKVRLTTEPGAPVFGRIAPDETHPHRQKELLGEVNKRLPTVKQATTYDIQAIRGAHEINARAHPEFCHQPRYGSQQYSDAFVDWIVEQYEKDNAFFDKARDRYYRQRHH
jgi:hypothetical protein